jgi:hypothetical protein
MYPSPDEFAFDTDGNLSEVPSAAEIAHNEAVATFDSIRPALRSVLGPSVWIDRVYPGKDLVACPSVGFGRSAPYDETRYVVVSLTEGDPVVWRDLVDGLEPERLTSDRAAEILGISRDAFEEGKSIASVGLGRAAAQCGVMDWPEMRFREPADTPEAASMESSASDRRPTALVRAATVVSERMRTSMRRHSDVGGGRTPGMGDQGSERAHVACQRRMSPIHPSTTDLDVKRRCHPAE